MAKAKKTKKAAKDGRTSRGEFRRKLWATAADVLVVNGAPAPAEIYPPLREGETHTLEQVNALFAEWDALVRAVRAKSKKRVAQRA